MEVTENSESLTLVNSSDHSVGRLGKLPMENVGCSFRTAPSKPKRRMVSSVRDFPLGCGPLAHRIQSSEVLETLVPEQKNVVESVKDEPVEICSLVSEALNKVVLSEPVKDLEDAAFDWSKIHVVGASASKKTTAKTFASRRTVSAIRDFPPWCGRNAPRHCKEESLEVLASLKNKSLCQDESDIADRPLEEMRKANVKQMGEDVQDGVAQKSDLWGNVASLRNKNLCQVKSDMYDRPVKETRKVDLRRMVEDVQDGNKQNSELWENVASLKNKSLCQDKSDVYDRPVEETRKADLRRMVEDVQDKDELNSKLWGNVSPLQNKSLCQGKSNMYDRPVEETRKADLRRMVEDVKNGDEQNSKLWGNVASLKNKSFCQDKSKMYDRPVEETRKAYLRRMVEDVQDGDEQNSKLWGNVASLKNKSFCQDKSNMYDRPVEETRKADLRQMVEDVQDGDEQNSELWGHVSMITGDKIRAKSDRCATKESRKQDEFGMASKVKVEQDDTREKCTRPSSQTESNQHQSDYKSKTVVKIESRDIGGLEEKKGKEIVVYEKDSSLKRKLSDIYGYQIQLQEDFGSLEPGMESAMGQGLMAVPRRCWKQGKGVYKPCTASVTSQSMGNKHNSVHLGKYKSVITTKDKAEGSGVKLKTHKPSIIENTANHGISKMVSRDKGGSLEDDDECKDFYVAPRPCSFGVNFPHFEQSVSVKHHDSNAITRSKVRETLRLFQAICRKLLQEDEANGKERGRGNRRFDLQASKILKENGKYVNTGKQILGSVPGVEIGDEFHYRIELNIIGLHRQIQGGIDYVKHDGLILATSIVASGGYADDLDNSDSLIYTGQGGNVMRSFKEPEDQKLARGNLALKSSMQEKNPVRVIRGYDSEDGKTYVYDGLYLVEKCWQDLGPHGKLVFKFQLERIPGQPELAWKEVKKSKKFKIREGLCVDDISQGKELIPICAVNTIDYEKPPPFKYITSMIYPNWCRPLPPKGCDCTNGCSDSEKCLCAVKNGGEIPYNRNGAIVEAKPLVYECGPSCKCSSSCHNRVCQHGIKFQLEIFKTKSRGWGVRSLNSIPSGSFICEYIGELLEEKEADQRTGNDEYLFDIGNNYNDSSLWDGLSSLMPDAHASSCEVVVGESGFTIDAAQYANVGRFVNHSCSPNMYAQNLLYDHEDKRVPHIMFFSAENIPPLQELTYYYNYTIDQIRDSNGNIKKKSCFCGSIECTGRMY
ncbi:hypothetical protein ACJW30_02G147400 [Castanea mollissima]